MHPLVLLSVVDHYRRVAKVRWSPEHTVARRIARGVANRPEQTTRRRSLYELAELLPFASQDSKKRVVGVLLGETMKGRLDITNSYAGARPVGTLPSGNAHWNSCILLRLLRTRAQFRSRRMRTTRPSGTSTIATTSRCTGCPGGSTVRCPIELREFPGA